MKTEAEYASALLEFVRNEFLHGADRIELTDRTPLIESGVLDSLRIAILLTYIRDELGVHVPWEKIDARNFLDVRTAAAMVAEAAAASDEVRA